jgi:hypothetical protein
LRKGQHVLRYIFAKGDGFIGGKASVIVANGQLRSIFPAIEPHNAATQSVTDLDMHMYHHFCGEDSHSWLILIEEQPDIVHRQDIVSCSGIHDLPRHENVKDPITNKDLLRISISRGLVSKGGRGELYWNCHPLAL